MSVRNPKRTSALLPIQSTNYLETGYMCGRELKPAIAIRLLDTSVHQT